MWKRAIGLGGDGHIKRKLSQVAHHFKQRQHERIEKVVPAMMTVGHHTVAATTKDLSVAGMFLFTDVLFQPGADLDIVLMLPKELALPQSSMVCCHGRIVRVETGRFQHGIAAQIERITKLPLAETTS